MSSVQQGGAATELSVGSRASTGAGAKHDPPVLPTSGGEEIYPCPFRDEPKPIPRRGQFCSDLRKPRDYKSGSPQGGSEESQSTLYEGEGEV